MNLRSVLRLLSTCVVLVAIPMTVSADIMFITNPTPVQQTNDHPCIIGDPSCSQGSLVYTSVTGPAPGGVYDLYSPVYQGIDPFTGYDTNKIPLAFSIGVDENTAQGQGLEYLDFFKTYICTSLTSCSSTPDAANSYIPTSPTAFPLNHNGSGWSDFELSGFSLTPGTYYKFEAQVSNDSDGVNEFFIIPTTVPPSQVPEPASILLLGTAILGAAAVARKRLVS